MTIIESYFVTDEQMEKMMQGENPPKKLKWKEHTITKAESKRIKAGECVDAVLADRA